MSVRVTYYSNFGGCGTTTPPTQVEAASLPAQVAEVFWADSDTEAIVIHNWGQQLGPSFATFRWPMVVMDKILGEANAGSFASQFTFGLTNSNQVYITKSAGSEGGTHNVYLFLPHSLIASS